ncbi:MAG: ATP-binding cassette domain-containing protein [Cohnella sp.]|nr:ATP-binding cassette domain-containing protein [Cohnella sp.]
MSYSYSPQSPENGLFSRTLPEELKYSGRPYRLSEAQLEERMAEALSAVGWDAGWLRRDPYRMSGGERRRAALAATFVPPAPWLLLDEPSAGLDGAGHARLGKYLMGLKERGVGVVLVSHDLDWALPLADSVLLLHYDGTVRQCSPAQLPAHPEWLAEAGMAVPLWLEVAHKLHLRGIPTEQLWSPESAAKAVADAGEVKATEDVVRLTDVASARRRSFDDEPVKHRLGAFDPRTIWLSYILLSLGIFAQNQWSGIAVSGALTFSLLATGRISLWRWKGLLRNYALFSVIVSAFFATGWLSFDTDAFIGTLLPFTRTYLVLLLGLCIPLVMTPLSLRNALHKLLTYRGRTPPFAHRLILTVTLMIRFVPVLAEEWERFARIDLSRGKTRSRRSWAIASKLKDMALPFMLSIFRLGDEIAIALESRGVARDIRPTRAAKLRFAVRDYGAVLGAALLLLGLWVYAKR